MSEPIKRLTCCCCGEVTRGRQWWNRDAGFGLCRRCGERILASGKEPEFERTYGVRGVHWDVRLYLGCTVATHRRIGIDAVVNARGGEQWRNNLTIQEVEMVRDAIAVQSIRLSRARHYQFGSRWFRRRLSHLLSEREA